MNHGQFSEAPSACPFIRACLAARVCLVCFSAWGNLGASGWRQCMVTLWCTLQHWDNPKQHPNPTPLAKDYMALLCQQERLLPSPPHLVPIEKDGDLESCRFTSFASYSVLLLQDTHVLAWTQHFLLDSSCKKSLFSLSVKYFKGITVTSLSKSLACCLSSLSPE